MKRILVTGANKGIGEALCKKLLVDFSDTYVLLGSRDAGRGQDAVEGIISQVGSEGIRNRIQFLQIDVSSNESVVNAASVVTEQFGLESLYAIVNNAAIGFGKDLNETIQTNVYGPKRVTEAFFPLLSSHGARIVNISSAVGPMYVAKCIAAGKPVDEFINSNITTWAVLQQRIDQVLQEDASGDLKETDAYGFSKACLNAYTMQTAFLFPHILVNSCTPGFIATDLTKGFGATNTPEMGTVSALHCLFDNEVGSGRYYGSDAVRSPLDRYRGPGDAPYIPSIP